MNLILPVISKCLVAQLMAFAKPGVGLEDIQAKLVACFTSDWGRFNKTASKGGKVKIGKDCMSAAHSVRDSYEFEGEKAADSIRFWYFVQETETFLGRVGDAHVGIPTSHKAWLEDVIGSMTPAVAKKEAAPKVAA